MMWHQKKTALSLGWFIVVSSELTAVIDHGHALSFSFSIIYCTFRQVLVLHILTHNTQGPTSRALARILKLPVIFERVPVKKVDVAGETQVDAVRSPSWVESRGLLWAPGGVQGAAPP